jgi:hypothetical protein
MRTLFFAYALLTLLSACSKDNSPSASTSGIAGSTCPSLDGTYTGLTNAGERLTYTFTTTRSSSITSYTFAEGEVRGTYPIPADGSKLTGETDGTPVSLTLSCGNNSLIMQTQTGNSAVVSMTFTDLGGDQLLAEAGGQSVRLQKQ